MLNRLFGFLLHLYPAHHRDEYGGEMARFFRDRCRRESAWRVCCEVLPDLAITAWREQMETFKRDVAYTIRAGARNPGFVAVVLITLALGIGANTAVFSVVKGVVLDPLPYKNPDRLVRLFEKRPKQGRVRNAISAPDFSDWRQQNAVFDSMTAVSGAGYSMTTANRTQMVRAGQVNASFFDMLGWRTSLGRDFLPSDEARGKNHVLILSYGFWRREFGGDSTIIGRKITLSSEPYEVIGVLPDLDNVIAPEVDVWQPLILNAVPNRGAHFLDAFARLRPGVTLLQARAAMDVIASQLERQYPNENTGHGVNIFPLEEELTGKVRPALLILLGAVGLVLLVACANVANLFIVRVAQRQRELSIRTALGAGAGQLVRQLLTESILLSLLGGAAGIILAVFGVKALVAANPADLPRLHNVDVDGEVLLFGCAIAILSGIVFGLAPAMHVARGKIADTMKLGGRHSAGRSNTRKALLIGEVALSLILVVGSGLLLQSFARLVAVNPGFDTERVLTVDVPLLGPRYSTAAKRLAFHTDLSTKLRALPGVTSIGATNALPLTPRDAGSNFAIVGRPPLGYSQLPNGRFRVVTPGYFETLRIPLRAGRFIAAGDTETAPGVVVINETMVRQYWPGEDPVGKRITLAGDTASNEIIGIVGDVKHYGLDGEVRPEMYFPYAQQPQGTMTVVLRSAADAESLTAAVRNEVRRIDPDQPITRIQTLDEVLSRAVAQPRFYATLLSIFSTLALVLAAVGIYGVMSFGVSQRVREMGIRMALGASAGGVLRLIMKEGLSLTGIGIGLGVAGGLACSRVLGKLLFGIAPTDLVTFAGAILLIVVTATTACYLPARRATRVDPAITLRGE